MVEQIKLNLGCWKFKLEGWVNVDADPQFGEVVARAEALPFPDNHADEVYAGHLLEHYDRDMAPKAIAEWKRVLKPGSVLTVTIPDVSKALRMVHEKDISPHLLDSIAFGKAESRSLQDHQSIWDEALLRQALLAEFGNCSEELAYHEAAAYNNIKWQTILQARK